MVARESPRNGQVAIVGTDAKNEIRFEPNLRGKFLRVQLALVDPVMLTKTIHDLNPHLVYTSASVPIVERDKSIGDPRGIVWNSTGTRAYITGMGSRNLIVVDATGRRLRSDAINLGEGPTGLALDEARGRLYVLNRFSATLSVVDTSSFSVVATVPSFDPTPEHIKPGRRLFYDTRRTSGLGHVSCASCHVDTRFDRLAWDLGVPDGEMSVGTGDGLVNDPRAHHPVFHPMKGPMVTLTLQDIIRLAPLFHWRTDRESLLDFHITFTDLLAMDRLPTVTEMRELELFLGSVRFPPNRYRKRDNTLSEEVPLPGHYGVATNGNELPLPNGSAVRGLQLFGRRDLPVDLPAFGSPIQCRLCHDCESLSSAEVRLATLPRSAGLAFRSPSLRSVAEKVGMNLSASESRAGFGFMHDGRADTLTRFLVDGFGFDDNQDIADMVAFLLSVSGGDLAHDCVGSDATAPVQDAHASVGRQETLSSPELSAGLADLMTLIVTPPRFYDYMRLDLIASGRENGTNRAWVWNRETSQFDSDRNGEELSFQQLRALASPDSPLTFMAVADGSGRRMAIDQDDDGVFDRSELEEGSDPFDITSPSNLPPPEDFPLRPPVFILFAGGMANVALDVPALDTPRHPNRRITFSFVDPGEVPSGASIDATGTRFIWDIPRDEPKRLWMIHLRVTDNARPSPEDIPLELNVRELKIQRGPALELPSRSALRWANDTQPSTAPVQRYEFKLPNPSMGHGAG